MAAAAPRTEGQEVPNRRVILKRHVTGFPTEDDMELVAGAAHLAVPPGSAAVVLKNLYLSCDPYMRGRMSRHERPSYLPDFVPGEALVGFGVSKVVASGQPDFNVGDLVSGITGWEEYTTVDPATKLLFKIKHSEIPLSYYTGVIGMPGLTAYFGLYDVAKPKKGDYVFVSAAVGAVGQIAGQLAKLTGFYVVGSAGSDEKVNLLKTKFGFDDAFNYKKEQNLNAALQSHVWDDLQYNLEQPEGVRNLTSSITKRVRMEGFVASDYFVKYPEFEEEMVGYLKDGKIAYIEDVAEVIEKAPAALIGLFTGRNVGKQLVTVARE